MYHRDRNYLAKGKIMKNFLIAVSLTAMLPGIAAAEDTMKDLIVALKPDKNPEAMLSERNALEEFLHKETGRSVKVIVPMSGAVIQEGLANGSIDVAYVSGLEMLQAEKSGTARLLLAVEIEGKPSYESYWVTLKEKPYKNVGELKGKPVAFASKTSTSGYLIPVYDLTKNKLLAKQHDPEEFFGKGNVSFGTGYVSAIERVLSGQAEAAAVSDYVIKGDKHLSVEQKDKLRVMDRQGPVPTHILAIRTSIGKKDADAIQKALLTFNKNSELRNRLFTNKLIKADSKKHLATLKEAFTLTGIQL
jgi:phosphonate transport system substrate-binding protein